MCQCCDRTRAGPAYSDHDPLCLHCGARLIWRIQRLPVAREDKIRRCRQVLADWMAHGHSEAEIRRLAKLDEMPIAELSTEPRKRGV